MSVVAASLYRNGKRIGPVSLDDPVRCATDRSEFVWIGLCEPSEAELRQLQENYNLYQRLCWLTHWGFPRSGISDSFGAGRFAPCHQR